MSPLLKTKLFIPEPKANLVLRPHLTARLKSSADCKLVLISAPAGFGKTTLAVEWLCEISTPKVWLSLDETDNDAVMFFKYLATGLKNEKNFQTPALDEMLQATQPADPQYLAEALLNDLATQRKVLKIILEDYHCISNLRIHKALDFILVHLPPGMQIVLITRIDPPLSISRLRVRSELIELRERDLRFTTEETTCYLNEISGLCLSEQEIGVLQYRTEGWIAVLQLATLSMQHQADRVAFVRAFSGTERYILDYLVDEVFSHLPSDVQGFLLKTSVLDQLSAPLCDAVCYSGDNPGTSQRMLEEIENANLFLIPLDDTRQWFRYHHLFAAVLVSRLQKDDPAMKTNLHRRAAIWLLAHDRIPEAMHQTLLGQDYDRAAAIIMTQHNPMMMRGELATLERWFTQIPLNIISEHPWMLVSFAWVQVFSGQYQKVEEALELLKPHLAGDTDEIRNQRGHVATIQAFTADRYSQIQLAIEYARQADTLLPPENNQLRGLLPYLQGKAYRMAGDFERASSAFKQLEAISLKINNIWTLVIARFEHMLLNWICGELHAASLSYESTLALIDQYQAQDFGSVAKIHLSFANVLYEWGQLEKAAQLVSQAIERMRWWHSPNDMVLAFILQARIELARGELAVANQACAKARELILQGQVASPEYVTWLNDAHFRLWLAQTGDQTSKEKFHQALPVSEGAIPIERMHLTQAREQLALGNITAAQSLLEKIISAARTGGRMGHLIEAFILYNLCLRRQQRGDAAVAALEEAVRLGEAEGYVQVFIDGGGVIIEQLAQHLFSQPHAEKIIATWKQSLEAPRKQNLIEPLTEREMDVLHLLSAGLTNQQIAGRLHIALDTVKHHTSNIYGKLSVSNRTQAVAKSRVIGLIK